MVDDEVGRVPLALASAARPSVVPRRDPRPRPLSSRSRHHHRRPTARAAPAERPSFAGVTPCHPRAEHHPSNSDPNAVARFHRGRLRPPPRCAGWRAARSDLPRARASRACGCPSFPRSGHFRFSRDNFPAKRGCNAGPSWTRQNPQDPETPPRRRRPTTTTWGWRSFARSSSFSWSASSRRVRR